MYQFFLLNVMIVLLVVYGLAITGNPLFVLLLLLLRDMPFGEPEEEEEYPSQPMGFNADIK